MIVVGMGQVGATIRFALMMSSLASTIVLVDSNSDLAERHKLRASAAPLKKIIGELDLWEEKRNGEKQYS